MKRTFYTIALAAALLAVGCQKEKGAVTLGADLVNSNTKVYIDNSTPKWNEGDPVWVNGNAEHAITDVNGTSGKIRGVAEASQYLAIYPAEYASGTASAPTVTIPAQQSYTLNSGNQKMITPMAAVTTGSHLFFYNLCSLVKVTVENNTGDDFGLKKITVKANNDYLGGTTSLIVDADNETVTANPMTSGFKTVTLTFPSNTVVADGESQECYIAVAPFANANDITITVHTSNNKKFVRTRSIASLDGNTIASARLNVDALQTTGYFTVNTSTNLKVRFSPGNLQYKSSSASDAGTFRFAEHQYDYVGFDHAGRGTVYVGNTKCNNIITEVSSWPSTNYHTNNLWIDLFGWGTSGQNRKGCYASSDNSSYGNGSNPIAGTLYDWGRRNSASLGGGVNWRTLTQQEWNTLLTGRGSHFPSIDGTRAKYLQVTLTGLSDGTHNIAAYGVIIFPDDFEWPESLPFPTNLNVIGQHSAAQHYTLEDWAVLEEAGAVYLPSTGYRQHTVEPNNANIFSNLYYWTATNSSSTNAYAVRIECNSNGTLTTTDTRSRSNGCAVRLVTEVQ